ncbi:MAG: metallophosphoesterase family protein [Pseudomonadota bacterium]
MNEEKRIFAIGDIHGCMDKLRGLMYKIPIDLSNDILVFLGDYIDRGPQSAEVVDYLIDLSYKYPATIFLRGNHEEMLQDYMSGCDTSAFLANGGGNTLASYLARDPLSEDAIFPASHVHFLKSLSLYYATETYVFVHAGLAEGVPLEKQQARDMLWIRQAFVRSTYDFGKIVVFGHTAFRKPFIAKNKIGIDTGAVYGNRLTCVELPAARFYSF